MWCRDFKHAEGNEITLVEMNGSLSIEIQSNKKTVSDEISLSPKLIKKGKKLVQRYVEEYEEIDESEEGYEAIPHSIVFFFCGITDPHQKLIDNFSLSVAVLMFPKDEDFDGEMTGLVQSFIPSYLSEATECTFTTFFNDPNNALTAGEIKKELISRGFVYDPNQCSLDQTL